MAEHQQQHYGHQQQRPTDAVKSHLPQAGPSTSNLLAVLTLFPVGGLCLILAGLILTGTLIGLAVATPLFVIFSPVLVPAVLTIGLAVTGFLTSGAFGITALSSLTYIVKYFRRMRGSGGPSIQEHVDHTKRKDVGQRAHESVRA